MINKQDWFNFIKVQKLKKKILFLLSVKWILIRLRVARQQMWIQNFLEIKFKKTYFHMFQNKYKKEINYKDFLLFFNIGDSLNAKSFFEAISEQHIIIISYNFLLI